IDGYKTDVSTARTNINTAVDNLATADEKLTTAESALTLAENELVLQKVGSTFEQIIAQEAQVEYAQASVNNYKAMLSKTVLRSPIEGIVIKQDIKAGEFASTQSILISIISDKQYQVEANIPEADIAKVIINDIARITLDAYGDDVVFSAKVIKIDPAETVIEGVSTYKTTLEFENEDNRIKSGMTANIDIMTGKAENVIFVPQRAVIQNNGDKIIRVVDSSKSSGQEIKEVKVETGLRGSDGNIEIKSGINEGDRIITFMK
ncbi:MAG: efflux RND transporter periplasmic adaptor subunit, partial [bacterium]